MDNDVLVKIFKELNMIEMANVSQVCCSWRLACSDPFIWNTLDLGLLKSSFIYTQASPTVYVTSESDRMLMMLLRLAMALSRGNITTLIFHFNLYMRDRHLCYIAERTPHLKHLVLPAWALINIAGMSVAINKWQELESLTMFTTPYPYHIMHAISRSCKNFSSLKIMGKFDLRFVLAISSYIPKLKMLSVRCSVLTSKALVFMLQRMDHLEVLNVSHCLLEESLRPIEEPDRTILAGKSARLREVYCCTDPTLCTTCQRMIADKGLMRWYRYEEWSWREDEVSSLSVGRDYGTLFDQRCLDLGFRN